VTQIAQIEERLPLLPNFTETGKEPSWKTMENKVYDFCVIYGIIVAVKG